MAMRLAAAVAYARSDSTMVWCVSMLMYKVQVGRDRRFVESSSCNDWEGVVCPRSPGHQRAGRRTTQLHLDLVSLHVVDFSRTMLGEIVVTERALQVLRGAGLTGFVAEPAVVASWPKGVSPPASTPLWELVVTGDAGPAHAASGITLLRHCEGCGLREYSDFKHGIVVDEATWDGTDFCRVREYPGHVLVSPRAKAVVEANRLSNIGFLDSALLSWPPGVVRPK